MLWLRALFLGFLFQFASAEEDEVVDSPQAAFDDATKNQLVLVIRDEPGHDDTDTINAMVFTTDNPEDAFDDLMAQAESTWADIDDGMDLHFSYRVTDPVAAQVRVRDNASLWSAFIMASYLNIDVPVLYAETGAEVVWDELHWWNFDASHFIPPTPEPTATPTISGIEIDGVKYEVAYGLHDIIWDNSWKGDRIVIEDYGVTARMFTGNGHENTRANKCFSEGQHMWRLQLYTNDDQRSTNVEWMVPGIVTEGSYFDSYNQNGRSCGILAHSKQNYCNWWGGIADGVQEVVPDQETLELLLDCDEGLLTYRFFDQQRSFVTYKVPVCNDSDKCLYPWLQMHYGDRHNSGTILGEPVDTFRNVWDDSDYEIVYGLKWDEKWMGDRIRCEEDCKVARMHTGNGHENTRTTKGWDSGKHAWRLKVYSNDNEKNTNAEWFLIGTTTEGSYYDTYNQNGRSCGVRTHGTSNACNSWGYVARGNDNQRVPSRQTVIMMLDSDEGLLYMQFQGRPEPWVAFKVAKNTMTYPLCSMHYGDGRQNACDLLGQMFEFENVNHHFEGHSNNG